MSCESGRKKLRLLALLALLVSPALARHCRSQQSVSSSQQSTISSSRSTQVVLTPPADVYPRRDIRELLNTPEFQPQLDLFIQAYAQVMNRPATSPVSYFQMASIHGQPYVAWDNVTSLEDSWRNATGPLGGTEPGQPGDFAGYCWHASVLFPTWHRAYTLLMEQEVRNEALAIAQEYGEKERAVYLEAAWKLRFPYWDWTSEEAGTAGIPEYTLQAQVTVNTPKGRKSIKNPLQSFTFPIDVASGSAGNLQARNGRSGDSPSLTGNPTLRHPDVNLQQQYDRLQNDLKSEITQSVRPAWFKLYTDPDVAKSWAAFATHAPRSDGRRPQTSLGSIEGIHDLVHDVLGGIVFGGSTGYPGHMSDVDTAAFDPIFFLHHANMDRLTALYQQKNPHTWLETTSEPYQRTYVTGPNGYTINSSTPLWPFRKAVDTFWTSDDMRDILALGYTYSDFFTGSSNGTMPPAPSPSPAADASCDDLLHAVVGFQPLGSSLADSKDPELFKPDDFSGFRWYLNFRDVPAGLCPGSALLSVHLRETPDIDFEASANSTSNSTLFAGSVAIFTHNDCVTCVHHVGVNGQVDLTEQLLELGLIVEQEASHYAGLPPDAQPEALDRPPPDFLESYVILIATCSDIRRQQNRSGTEDWQSYVQGRVEMSSAFKKKVLSLAWGRLVGTSQVVGS